MNSSSIRSCENGGPEVLRWENTPVADPEDHGVLRRHHAIGDSLAVGISTLKAMRLF